MLTRYFQAALLLIVALQASHPSMAATPCGDVTIAQMNWPSAELIAEIDKAILSAGFGCNAELVAGDTLPTVDSMANQGTPDLAPELWAATVSESLDSAVAAGKVIIAAEVLSDGGEEGWWIPKYLAEENPDIKTPEDALARPELFPAPEDESKGAIHNCPEPWKSCQIATVNLFKAYNADEKGFVLVDSGSAAALDGSIARAHQRQQGWLGYYWAPTATLGRYEMVKLDMGAHDSAHWDSCTTVIDCADPEVNNWDKRNVVSAVTDQFAKQAGDAMSYISKRQWNNTTMNLLLAWMADNQASGEETAAYFLANYEDIWAPWVPANAAGKVRASL